MMSLQERLKQKRMQEPDDDNRRLRNRVLPLRAFYGQDPKREAERQRFINDCRYAFTDWSTVEYIAPGAHCGKDQMPGPGYGERGRNIAAIERGRLIAINLNSAPFEYLSSFGHLESREDKPGAGNARWSAGVEFDTMIKRAEISALGSKELDGTAGGTGTYIAFSEAKLLANSRKMALQRSIGMDAFNLLFRLIHLEEWMFEGKSKRHKKDLLRQIQYALDLVALDLGMIMPREFDARWKPASKPAPAPPGEQQSPSLPG